jgi:Pyruvate/2-oxoacid:ferredoxin oxidoreductase gamma subunit
MEQSIITAGSIIGSAMVIGGFLFALYKIVKRFENLEEANKCRKEESVILIKSTFAMLDGLHQLGANGPVTQARENLQEYIIKRGD